jgi:hypothetical protein
MLACHLHFLDAVGRVIRTERLEASSDEQATMIAEERMGSAARCEIWCGHRLIARLKAPDPLAPSDQ